jgi:hypothetical protein
VSKHTEKKKNLDYKAFDINGDGTVDFQDLKAIFTGERSTAEDSMNFVEKRVHKMWSKHEHRFVLLSVSIQKREREGRHWLRSRLPFGQDRKINSILTNLSGQFEDRELLMMRTEFIACVDRLKNLDGQLADVKASQAMHSNTDEEKYIRTISKIESKILRQTQERAKTLRNFRDLMEGYGVVLSEPQAEVLLSRIDAGDVTKMASVFVVISGITRQFSGAKKESGENIDVAKKYYAIYIGLLELQVRIQSEYIERIDSQYLPDVTRIGNDARNLAAETRAILKSASNDHSDAYHQNIESQEFTITVTEIYEKALKSDREKVVRARALIEELHKLAENTLSTVRVSADLTSLVRQAEGMYQEVMSLQTPALVPFENLQLQREFEAVTVRLRNGN